MFKGLLYRLFRRSGKWKEQRLTQGGRLLLIMLFFSGLIGLNTSLSLVYQVFALLLALLLIAIAWTPFFHLHLDVTRVLPQFGTAGELLEYRLLVMSRSSRTQRGLLVTEQTDILRPTLEEFVSTPEPSEEKRNIYDRTLLFYRWRWLIKQKQCLWPSEHSLPELPPKTETEVRLNLMPLRRGELWLKGVTFIRSDPLNLLKAFVRVPLPDFLLILPKRYELPGFSLPGTRKFKQGGETLASSIGESDEFVSLRDYRPGDPLRHIHWRSWAKTGKPVVKEYQDEYFVRHALILDTFQQAAYSDVFEEAVSLAASFAYTVNTQDTLLDLMFVGPEAYCFTAGRSLGHTEDMLKILASVAVCSDKPFSVLSPLVIQRASLLSGCICILLAWDDERKALVEQLNSVGLPLLVFVVIGQQHGQPHGSDIPENIHFLETGKIQEGLNTL